MLVPFDDCVHTPAQMSGRWRFAKDLALRMPCAETSRRLGSHEFVTCRNAGFSGNNFLRDPRVRCVTSVNPGTVLARGYNSHVEVVMTMVVRMFETLTDAQRAVSELVQSGYARNAISILVRDAIGHARPRTDVTPDHGPLARATNIIAGGPLGLELHRDGRAVGQHAVARCLKTAGLQLPAARFFADAICNGAILVAVHCLDSEVRDARDILDVHHASGWPAESGMHLH